MPDFDWDFDDQTSLLRFVVRGTLHLDEISAFWGVLESLDHDPNDVRALIDTRAADLSYLTVEDFKDIETKRRRGEVPMGRVAALVGHDRDLSIGRLWAALRNESAPGSTAVFLDEAAAITWLLDAGETTPADV